MARPLRIEFEGAWYHVINRGAAKCNVFLTDNHRNAFLSLLNDLRERFEVETHAYCLMGNHYHLLLHTPRGNLARAIRHLNGVYTQRFNRDQGRDGPLFRGRYKSVLVDADSYLLQLSRYIHRNPIEGKIVKRLESFPWSSYPAYINRTKPPSWLIRQEVYGALGGRAARYRQFVESNNETEQIYSEGQTPPILGDNEFKQVALSHFEGNRRETPAIKRTQSPPSMDTIATLVTQKLDVPVEQIYESRRGQRNLARLMVMHFATTVGHMTHRQVAAALDMGHYSSVSSGLQRLQKQLSENKHVQRIKAEIHEKISQSGT